MGPYGISCNFGSRCGHAGDRKMAANEFEVIPAVLAATVLARYGRRPKISSSTEVGTKTLPPAMVGAVNFEAAPAVSRPLAACVVLYSSTATLVALYACSTAGPPSAGLELLKAVLSMSQTIPFNVPLADKEAVAPCSSYTFEPT